MGLDCSHDAWHGSYSAFMRWRQKIAEVAGLPPLELMEGFFDSTGYGTLYFGQPLEAGKDTPFAWKRSVLEETLPIRWGCLKPSALHELLYHSDCDGKIIYGRCKHIANELEKLLPLLPDEDAGGHIGNWREKTQKFIDGLRRAHAAKEALRFA